MCSVPRKNFPHLCLERAAVFCSLLSQTLLHILIQIPDGDAGHAINVINDCSDCNRRYFFRKASRLTTSAGADDFSASLADSGVVLGPPNGAGFAPGRAAGADVFLSPPP